MRPVTTDSPKVMIKHFSIPPSFYDSVFSHVEKKTQKGEEVLFMLDFDDTIINFSETGRLKTPIINDCLVEFLTNIIVRLPEARFKFGILSARYPDEEMILVNPELDHFLIRTALPIFLDLLNDKLEKKSLDEKKINSIDASHIFCLGGKQGYTKRVYMYESYEEEDVFSEKSLELHFWKKECSNYWEEGFHQQLTKDYFPMEHMINYIDGPHVFKGKFLAERLKRMNIADCVFIDDNLSQIRDVCLHAPQVVPVIMTTRVIALEQQPVAPQNNAQRFFVSAHQNDAETQVETASAAAVSS